MIPQECTASHIHQKAADDPNKRSCDWAGDRADGQQNWQQQNRLEKAAAGRKEKGEENADDVEPPADAILHHGVFLFAVKRERSFNRPHLAAPFRQNR